jgi:hypothetical protein
LSNQGFFLGLVTDVKSGLVPLCWDSVGQGHSRGHTGGGGRPLVELDRKCRQDSVCFLLDWFTAGGADLGGDSILGSGIGWNF